MSECEEIANTINRLVEAGHIAKAQELLELALDDYFVLQLAMFANTKVNAYVTIAAWKQAGLRLPAEDTDEFFPYRDSLSVTEEQTDDSGDKARDVQEGMHRESEPERLQARVEKKLPDYSSPTVSEQKTELVGHEKKKAGMTPEAYIAAVKACPPVMWVTCSNTVKLLWRGHATRVDGTKVEVVPDYILSSKSDVRSYANHSTPERLAAWGNTWTGWPPPLSLEDIFFGEIPPEDRLRAYYVSKHGQPSGLNRLFPRRIERPAAIEWVEEQVEQQRAQKKLQRARDLWERYYCMFDERHVSQMSGAEFERFIGKLYTRLGYRVSLTQSGADQGVDLILCKDDHKIAVQAKRWTGIVGNKAVQEVMAGKLYYGCSQGWIVTSSTFSSNAVALAAKDPTISLVDGRALTKLCEQFRTAPIPDFSWDEWEKIEHVAVRFG